MCIINYKATTYSSIGCIVLKVNKMKILKFILLSWCSLLLISCSTGATTNTTSVPTFCQSNVANFTRLNGISLIGSSNGASTWGPNLASLSFPSVLNQCESSLTWQQARIMASASYWVGQKPNYCHHHVPTWLPDTSASFGVCATNPAVMPPVPVESMIRWNYSGNGLESAVTWYNINSGLAYPTGNYGYGLDCSDYTHLVYAYGESIVFTSDISMQAGQTTIESNLAPNMVGFVDSTTPDVLGLYAAGQLVCADGTVAPIGATNTSCDGHGGYISVFNSSGVYSNTGVTDAMLNNLQAGDLLYIGGCASDPNSLIDTACNNNPRQQVTHVIIWTAQQIGSSLIAPNNVIAPETDKDVYGSANSQCGTTSNPYWWSVANNVGNWIITDSHYQGPDFRAFTSCFYRNQVWGVRRVLLNN